MYILIYINNKVIKVVICINFLGNVLLYCLFEIFDICSLDWCKDFWYNYLV